MREIKFRGRTNAGYWVYGDLFRYGNSQEDCKWSINEWHPVDGWVDYHIQPETLGQFTGLTDKNGREIYEGDVVECVSWNEYFSDGTGKPMEAMRRKMRVEFINGAFKMVEPMPAPMKDNAWDIIYNGDIIVIGNIHDNPELLKS